MITLELTPEEYYMLMHILERTRKRTERKRAETPWIKQDGYMVNKFTGKKLDTSTNRFVN